MSLPREALERLAEPLEQLAPPAFRQHHTLPAPADIWSLYSGALRDRADELAATADGRPGPEAGFNELRSWVGSLVKARGEVMSLLLALEPFEPFDDAACRALVEATTNFVRSAADALRSDRMELSGSELHTAALSWPREGGTLSADVLRTAFGLEHSPVDDTRDFRPALVFREFAYNPERLWEKVAPHLMSLGLRPVDRFTAVSVVGWICWAPDPVRAYVSMESFIQRMSGAASNALDEALRHFTQRSRTARQGRRELLRTMTHADRESSDETRAFALASTHRRLAEGPVRHYGWAMTRLSAGQWSPPPTLAAVRDAMKADGHFLETVASQSLLVDLRNGDAHEDLTWDAHDEVLRVNSMTIRPETVLAATLVALSFDRGCAAALAYFRVVHLGPPAEILRGRSTTGPDWETAEAYFGDNNLQVVRSELDARHGQVWLRRLRQEDINPCFQALLCASHLLPQNEDFSVYLIGDDRPAITLTRSELEIGDPPWRRALETFDRMPLCTFLPLNLAARQRSETPTIAARSAAWIAVDGILDAYDGSSLFWDQRAAQLVLDGLELIDVALAQCALIAHHRQRTDLHAAAELARRLSDLVLRLDQGHIDWHGLEDAVVLKRLRHLHGAWGPVSRLPGIAYTNPDHLALAEPRPARRIPSQGASFFKPGHEPRGMR